MAIKERRCVMKNKKGIIICGFAGIGKTRASHTIPNVVDLESTPFEKDWGRYIKVAKHMLDSGYIVLLSAHKELREELQKQNIEYIFALPFRKSKEEYVKRYVGRGNSKEFIDLLYKNWDNFTNILPNENSIFITSFLSDALKTEGLL